MGRELSETSWESLEDLKDAYPSFKLEDELFVEDRRNVIYAFVGHQYKCRSNK
jgi:transcriptional regulator GlxA family with amidase domain